MLRFVLFPALVGCVQTSPEPGSAPLDAGARVTEGSPEALGMLAFLNDASTTFDRLDIEVGLDRRAAESLVHHRNGADGVLGTADDDRFDTIAEVDACYYVGDAALAAIEGWALDHDWVATDPDAVLGTWDGVTFTVGEAEAVIELSNTTGPAYLDDGVGLDSRAVDSIVAARPLDTVQQLAGLYYVGTSALTKLKEAAAGEPDCAVPGWETAYVYADDGDLWRSEVPSGLADLVDSLLRTDDWCGGAYGEPWFVKATIDRFDCVEKGYTIELGQLVDEHHGLSWYIEFEVDAEFDTDGAVCEI